MGLTTSAAVIPESAKRLSGIHPSACSVAGVNAPFVSPPGGWFTPSTPSTPHGANPEFDGRALSNPSKMQPQKLSTDSKFNTCHPER